MAHIMATAMPFTGHVSPVLAVASALVARGHEVRVYTGSAFRGRVEASGAWFLPWTTAPDFDENDLGATFPRLKGRKGLGQVFVNLEDLFIRSAEGQVADLVAEFRREPWDLLVGEESSVGPAFTAELTGSPWATVAILPLNLPSRFGPPSGLGLTPGGGPVGRARDAALRSVAPAMMRPLRRPLAEAREAVGLPPSESPFDRATYSPELIVASGVAALDHHRPDRPEWLHWVGELAGAAPTAALPPWWGDVSAADGVVHVTQGTQNIDPNDLIRPTLDALADEDVLVIASTGVRGRDELPFPVPRNARVAGFLPYAQLLPLTDLVITNGGWGGVLAALGRGIPLIVAGGDLDKPEIAARVASAGAGVNLHTGRPRARAIARAYERVMTDASYRTAAEAVGAALAAAGGASRAAELLEGMVGTGQG